MASSSYDEALRRLLVHEGGYSNHPSDPGGPTNFGITIFDYRKYVKPGATADDVRGMKVDEAKAIYRSKYWNVMRCGDLPAGLDYAVFDYGVNSGIGRAGKVLRRVLHLSDAASTVTDDVIRAARAADARQTIAGICDERLAFLQRLRTWPVFGRGWGRRVAEVKAAALAMADAAGKGAKAPTASEPALGKGAAKPNNGMRNTTIGGAVIAGGAAVAQSHGTAISIAVLIMTIVIVAGAYFFWLWRHRQKQEAPVKN
jgi:lysozyme family protein